MITRHQSNGRLSHAVVSNGLVFLAGQVADDLGADLQGQARQILAKIDNLLSMSGTDRTKLLQVTIWLRDVADFAEFNVVWDAWVPNDCPPARACIESRIADPKIRVEIGGIAAAA